jgi:hypothetical protein
LGCCNCSRVVTNCHIDSPVMVGAHRMADLPGMGNRVRQGGAA